MIDSQSYMVVDLDAITNNYLELKRISEPAMMAAVVKANAYGLGVEEVSRHLEKLGVDYFCVATASEALELRRLRIYKPILVFGYVHRSNFRELLQNRIALTVFDLANAQTLNQVAKDMNVLAEVHIKIDSGMGRLGLSVSDESVSIIEKIEKLSNLHLKGIYSHFSSADEFNKMYTQKQYEKFMDMVLSLQNARIYFDIRHISNDAGAIFHGYYMDMIRSGLSLYGYYSSDVIREASQINLVPAASVFTTVTNVKTLHHGDAVSYNRTFVAHGDMKVASLAIGYADGFPISLSNRGSVLINGKKARVIGKVCMDQTMVDVTHIDDVRIGDPVLVYGRSEWGDLSVYEMARNAETIVYDLLCRTNMRIPRRYLKDGKIISVKDYLGSYNILTF